MKKILLIVSCIFLSSCHSYTNYYTDYVLITSNAKIKYLYNDELDLNNIYLKGDDGSIVPVTSSMVSGYDRKYIGNQQIVVTYNNINFVYEVQVAYFYIEI